VTGVVPSDSQSAPDSQAVAGFAMRVWRLRLWTWLWFLGALPLALVVYLLSGSESVACCSGAFSAAMSCAGGMALGIVPCPRCRQFFFVGREITNPFSSRCLNCGLSLKS
jgi:hypothetical protein